jgi:hypothetical protein
VGRLHTHTHTHTHTHNFDKEKAYAARKLLYCTVFASHTTYEFGDRYFKRADPPQSLLRMLLRALVNAVMNLYVP